MSTPWWDPQRKGHKRFGQLYLTQIALALATAPGIFEDTLSISHTTTPNIARRQTDDRVLPQLECPTVRISEAITTTSKTLYIVQ